ncbi:MAG: hypothetical protein OXH96_02060 [Spirochaetaceae bacterium]|nr:hypothetical protein [Spirochaetaceae bacterium]
MTVHDTPEAEPPDAQQRKRIEAMTQDPAMQQVAATARPRGPERSPQPGNPGKQRIQRRLAIMAETAERDPEIKQRIQKQEKAARKRIRPGRQKTEAQGRQLVPTSWDDRRHVNLAGPLANTRHVVPARELQDGQTALPFDYDLLQRAAQPPAKEPRFEVGYLPFLEIESRLVPCALLDLWDTGAGRGKHGPVPLPRRIGLEVLLSAPPDVRVNEAVLMSTTMAKLYGGVSPRTKYVPKRHGPSLTEALRVVHNGKVTWRNGARGARRVLVSVRDWPGSFDSDEPLSFDLRLPPGSRQGPQIDRNAVRMTWFSHRHNRLLLTAYCLFDKYGTVNGRMVSPTMPVVGMNKAGYVIDARGNLVTENGKPTRRVTHPRAVQTGDRRPNPEALAKYPVLTGRDLILAGYSRVADTPKRRYEQRQRVLEAATDLAEPVTVPPKQGATDRRRPALLRAEVLSDGPDAGLQLMPTDEYLAAHAARWAARRHTLAD